TDVHLRVRAALPGRAGLEAEAQLERLAALARRRIAPRLRRTHPDICLVRAALVDPRETEGSVLQLAQLAEQLLPGADLLAVDGLEPVTPDDSRIRRRAPREHPAHVEERVHVRRLQPERRHARAVLSRQPHRLDLGDGSLETG